MEESLKRSIRKAPTAELIVEWGKVVMREWGLLHSHQFKRAADCKKVREFLEEETASRATWRALERMREF